MEPKTILDGRLAKGELSLEEHQLLLNAINQNAQSVAELPKSDLLALPPLDPSELGGYVRKTMQPNEYAIAKTTLHWIIFVQPWIVAIVSVAIGVMIDAAISAQSPDHLPYVTLAGVLFGAIWFIEPLILRHTSELVVTNKRVLVKAGLFSRSTFEMFLSKIESVRVEQSILGRILGYGTVIIHGSGGSSEAFPRIANAIAYRNTIQQVLS